MPIRKLFPVADEGALHAEIDRLLAELKDPLTSLTRALEVVRRLEEIAAR
jgi:hypothetical protein